MTQKDSQGALMDRCVQIMRLARSEVRVSKGWVMMRSEN